MIDFELGEKLTTLRDRVRRFVDSEVIPREPEVVGDVTQLERVRRELQARAKSEALFLPTASKALGGLGLSWTEISVVLEEAGRSLLARRLSMPRHPMRGTSTSWARWRTRRNDGATSSRWQRVRCAPALR